MSALIFGSVIFENDLIRRRPSSIRSFSPLGAALSIVPDPEHEPDLISVLERAIVLALDEDSNLTVQLL
jgi:hypothetical protein